MQGNVVRGTVVRANVVRGNGVQGSVMKWLSVALISVMLSWAQFAHALPDAVNVNTADAQELAQALEGVGHSRAQAIIEYRDRFGPFINLEDLQEVSGIGPALIDANKDRIVFSQ